MDTLVSIGGDVAVEIVALARALGRCDHYEIHRDLHCPLCGSPTFRCDYSREDVYAECSGGCEMWGVARALSPHIVAAGLDPAPLWAGVEKEERRHGAAPMRIPFRTAYEFAQDTPPALTMLIDGLIAHGCMTEFLAAPKAGKTTLMMSAIAAVLNGDDFLGRRTRRVPVIYFTEENAGTFRLALERAGLLGARDLHVVNKREVGGATLATLIPAALQHARRFSEPGWIIVDTLAKFAGFEDDEENTSGAARVALEPLEAAAAAGYAVLYTRHDRKGGGSLVEAGRGSSVFAGTADVLLGLRRAEGRGQSTRRTLSGIGRIDGLPDQMVIDYAAGAYRVVGEGPSAVADSTQMRILEILAAASGQAVPTTALRAALSGVSPSTITRELQALAGRDLIETVKQGRANGYRLLFTT